LADLRTDVLVADAFFADAFFADVLVADDLRTDAFFVAEDLRADLSASLRIKARLSSSFLIYILTQYFI
jgi:hypothetical protein